MSYGTPMIDDSYPVYLLVIAPDIRCSNVNSIYNIILVCLNIHTHLFVQGKNNNNNKTLELHRLHYINIYIYSNIHKWCIPMIPQSTRWGQFPDASRGLFNKITTVMEPTSCSLTDSTVVLLGSQTSQTHMILTNAHIYIYMIVHVYTCNIFITFMLHIHNR